MSVPRKLASYRRLSPAERTIVRVAMKMLWMSRAALIVAAVPAWRKRLRRAAADAAGISQVSPRRTARLVETAASYVIPRPTCLHRSLVLEALLLAQGHHPIVHFGVRRRRDEVEAHSWVEHEGEALTPPGDEHAAESPFVTARPQ
jgi:hypothetical protein